MQTIEEIERKRVDESWELRSCFECFWVSPGEVRTRHKNGHIREPHRQCELLNLNPEYLEWLKVKGTHPDYTRYMYPIYESNAKDVAGPCPNFRPSELGDWKEREERVPKNEV